MKSINRCLVWTSANLFIILKRKWYLLVISLGLIFVITTSFRWGLLCSSIQPHLHIRDVCKIFEGGKYAGDLCYALCQHGALSSVSCHSFFTGKQTVFSGFWHNNSVVFKLPKKPQISSRDFTQWLDNPSRKLPSESEFTQMIKKSIKLKFNVSLNEKDVKKISYFGSQQSNNLRHTEMANVWSLIQDNEYLAHILYEKYDIFPKVLGSCGPLFAVQQMTSISGYWHLITLYDSRAEWINRAKIALKILDFIKVLDTGPLDPLHICDVKMSHFGLTNDNKKIKYLDLDSVHPHSIISKITGDGSQCVDHDDCDFYDCRSLCNLLTFRCQYGVANNNYQIVCEKIFLGWVVPGKVMVPGLLLGRHTPHSLVDLVQECANPSREEGKARSPTPHDVQKRLYDYLTILTSE